MEAGIVIGPLGIEKNGYKCGMEAGTQTVRNMAWKLEQ
jgi:hypothetical protein